MKKRGNFGINTSNKSVSNRCRIAQATCLITIVLCVCCARSSEYDGLPNKGSKELPVNITLLDTLHIDAAKTSLSGEWKMQVYTRNVMSGEFRIIEPLEVIGECDGIYYAAAKEDLLNEKFRIVRFRIDLQK